MPSSPTSFNEPLLFEPILKQRAWGGDRLRRFGKRVPIGARIGESWEVADLPDSIAEGRNRVAVGRHAGATLRELLASDRAAILGPVPCSGDGGFPLLVKYLDAHEHLSVQVHPDAAYAASHPGAHLKTEAWVILDAEAGAVLYRGIRPEVDRERFFADLERSEAGIAGETDDGVLDHLIAIPVRRGDCVYLPSGICHALGAGIVAAEVQTPSDTTFRVFDWNRRDPARPLHIAEAKACMRFGEAQEDGTPAIVRGDLANRGAGSGAGGGDGGLTLAGVARRSLCTTGYFAMEWVDAMPGAHLSLGATGMPEILALVEGSLGLRGPDGGSLRIVAGDTLLLPASLDRWSAEPLERSTILRTTLPVALAKSRS
jgi:mannose-6-phosphate isomerase